jgi:hypothetical protein
VLIACNHTVEEIAQIFGADSVGYLPIEDVFKLGAPGTCQGYCAACFDGNYPTETPKEERGSKFDQKISENKKAFTSNKWDNKFIEIPLSLKHNSEKITGSIESDREKGIRYKINVNKKWIDIEPHKLPEKCQRWGKLFGEINKTPKKILKSKISKILESKNIEPGDLTL